MLLQEFSASREQFILNVCFIYMGNDFSYLSCTTFNSLPYAT